MWHKVTMTVILASLLLVEYVGLGRPFRAMMEAIVSPFLAVGHTVVVSFEYPIRTLQTAVGASQKIRALESQYANALAELSILEGVRAENEELRALLEDTDRSANQVLIASPIFSQARSAIDAGTLDQVKVGQVVLVKGTVVGLIAEVSERFSLITLLAELQEQSLVVETASGYRGLIKGDGKHILLTEVPHDAAIAVGEAVVTVGQPGVPRDVLVGTIARDTTKSESPTKTFIIEQNLSFSEARMVELYL